MRRTFSSLSSLLNPRPAESVARSASPSSSATRCPSPTSAAASASAVVDLPAPLSPVNQTHAPRPRPSTWLLEGVATLGCMGHPCDRRATHARYLQTTGPPNPL